ncbi:MAG TPA: hypothetical protein VLE53_17360 [Gemmatimonadaceae bacterium]|nr:hypothetical protein [Gemmatimonadaceae bacterium]
MKPAPDPTRHTLRFALLLGAAVGLIILGIGGRIAMRVFALVEGLPPGLSLGGSMTVIFLGAAWGLVGGGLLWLGRRLFHRSPLARGTLFWVVVALLGLRGLNPVSGERLLVFAPLILLYGATLYRVWCHGLPAARRLRMAVPLVLVFTLPIGSAAEAHQGWTVDARPVLTLGADPADTSVLFAAVEGATRLPNGQILVGDRGAFTLHLFSATGTPIRRLGRKGRGPGEVEYLKALLRCGDSLVTLDVEGNRVSVFSLDGVYRRSFRFGSPQAAHPPYHSACNARGTFAHYGWEQRQDMKEGAYRPAVPFWISGADSVVRKLIGTFPGSERYGLVVGGQFRGSRPLPLGKQPDVAVGSNRIYIGTADRYEIFVFDLEGNAVDTIKKPTASLETARADIENAREKELASRDESWRSSIERDYAAMPFPRTVPAYRDLVVDSDDNLWVQDFPRTRSPQVRWTVFAPSGTMLAEVALPVDLEVYEIGRDYVLGRFLNAEESIPQVRMYRLRRGT